jgi:hypothetical protein
MKIQKIMKSTTPTVVHTQYYNVLHYTNTVYILLCKKVSLENPINT